MQGEAGIINSPDDVKGQLRILKVGETISLKPGSRHRIIGLDDWAVIGEIWQHTDSVNFSNEEDIVRVQDDFGR